MFDYALVDRPIVIYADDWDTYRAIRGVYFDLLSGSPGDTHRPSYGRNLRWGRPFLVGADAHSP